MSDDFFGDLGKSITKVTQRAVGKTGTLIESSRINALITQKDAEVKGVLAELGSYFYTRLSDGSIDVDESLGPIVERIAVAKEELLGLRTELAEVKGMQVCPHCEDIIALNASFCPSCGKSLADETEEGEESVSAEDVEEANDTNDTSDTNEAVDEETQGTAEEEA